MLFIQYPPCSTCQKAKWSPRIFEPGYLRLCIYNELVLSVLISHG